MSRYLRTREAEERGNTAAGEEGGAAEQEQQNPPLPSPSLLQPEYMPRHGFRYKDTETVKVGAEFLRVWGQKN